MRLVFGWQAITDDLMSRLRIPSRIWESISSRSFFDAPRGRTLFGFAYDELLPVTKLSTA